MKLTFMRCDSENITSSIPPNSVDFVVDIESSFFYPNLQKYFCEVNKVLKDDGMFFLGLMCLKSKLV
jgi:hypothetical protein